jgi:hypothetical protein
MLEKTRNNIKLLYGLFVPLYGPVRTTVQICMVHICTIQICTTVWIAVSNYMLPGNTSSLVSCSVSLSPCVTQLAQLFMCSCVLFILTYLYSFS